MEKVKNNNITDNEELIINLGFAEKATNKDFQHEKFPSKIGGNPVMLFPIEEKNAFTCLYCGGKMNFLMQLYCSIDELPHCYHRYLYLFFCARCYRNFPSFKCFRMQLPEKSEFYNGVKAKDIKQLQSFNPDLNTKYTLSPEYLIEIEEESEKSYSLYNKLAKKVYSIYDNHGKKKKELIDNYEDLEELEYDPQLSKDDNKIISNILKNYKEVDESKLEGDDKIVDEAEDEFFDKMIEKNGFKIEHDIVFKFFFNIIRENSDQVVRYSRSNIRPLWYSSHNVMKEKDIVCKNCKKNKKFEFQVMPQVFMLYDILLNHDIGTIVIYSCDCDVRFSEEHVYVQRTGEKLVDLNNKVDTKYEGVVVDDNFVNKSQVEKSNNVGFSSTNEPDEEGFVEIVNKKNKNKKKKEVKDDDSFSD